MRRQTLIIVHGNSAKPEAEALRSITLDALRSGLEREPKAHLSAFDSLTTHFPYFADLTLPFHGEGKNTYDANLDLEDLHTTLAALKQLNKKKNFSLSAYDRLPGKSALKEFAASMSAPLLHAVGLSKNIITRMDKALGAYWTKDSDLKANILKRIRTSLAQAMQRDDDILLVSNGAGNVYAYDALWQLSRLDEFKGQGGAGKISNWLTLGSPLGDPTVQGLLEGADRSKDEKYPGNVRNWHNFSAEDDYLSHDNTVRDDFSEMIDSNLVDDIRDKRIYNLAVRFNLSNPHHSLGYLNHPSIANVINQWLKGS